MSEMRTLVPSEPDQTIYALDIDWDLISHLADPEAVMILRREQLSPDVIEDELARKAFEWQMEHLRNEGKPATGSVLEDEFPQIRIDTPQTTIVDLISRLRSRYVRNSGRQIIRQLTKANGEDPLTLSTIMLQEGRRLADLTTARGDNFGAGDLDIAKQIYDKKVLRGPGPTLGFKELDDHFNGIKGMTFLLAPPKTYKSWFCGKAVLEAALKGHQPCLYSLELPAEDTDMRLRCMAADVPFWKYEKGALTNEDWERINIASEAIQMSGSYKVVKPPPGERNAHHLVEKAAADGATAIYIDQLQYVENLNGTSLGSLNDTGQYWDALHIFKDYSDDIPMFVVHQFNRSVLNAKEMPEMQQAKGSSALEEIGHLVLGLWANKDMRRNNIVEIGTLASRSYSYKNWYVGVELSQGCGFDMIGEVEDEDE